MMTKVWNEIQDFTYNFAYAKVCESYYCQDWMNNKINVHNKEKKPDIATLHKIVSYLFNKWHEPQNWEQNKHLLKIDMIR